MDHTSQYKEAFPLTYRIFDNDLENVLYIEEHPGQVVTVSIENSSDQVVRFADLAGPGQPHHIGMGFRKGTLNKARFNGHPVEVRDGPFSITHATREGLDVLCLTWTGPSLILPPKEKIAFTLHNIVVDGSQGARGTRIVFETQNIHLNDSDVPLRTTQEVPISIVNHRGKKNIPLDFSFSGKDTILNDGSENTIKLYISNLAVYKEYQSTVSFLKNDDNTQSSKIILSFVTNATSASWALGTKENSKDIVVESEDWDIEYSSVGEDPAWILTPRETFHLKGTNSGSKNHISVRISNIRTTFEAGHAALHVRYENIPGYWDGQTQLILKKQALQFYTQDNYVGIGTNTPGAALEVKGDVLAKSFAFGKSGWMLNGEVKEYSSTYNGPGGLKDHWVVMEKNVLQPHKIIFTNLLTHQELDIDWNLTLMNPSVSIYNSSFLLSRMNWSPNIDSAWFGRIMKDTIQISQISLDLEGLNSIDSVSLHKNYGVISVSDRDYVSYRYPTKSAVYYFKWSEDKDFDLSKPELTPLHPFDFDHKSNKVIKNDNPNFPIGRFRMVTELYNSWIFVASKDRMYIYRLEKDEWVPHQVIEAALDYRSRIKVNDRYLTYTSIVENFLDMKVNFFLSGGKLLESV